MSSCDSESDVNKTGQGALDELRSADNSQIARLYDMYRGDFIAFVRKYLSVTTSDAVDLYQECFVALYDNVRAGRLKYLSVSLKTYLFRIARNKILNQRRNLATSVDMLPENCAEESSDWQQKQEIAYTLVQQMEEPCNTVLTLYYWEHKSMRHIAKSMNYASEQVAKNRKLACMRKLKEILKKRFIDEGLM